MAARQANVLVLFLFSTTLMTMLILTVSARHSQAIGMKQMLKSGSNLAQRKAQLQGSHSEIEGQSVRRKLIGSTTPICTYNECRGCKYRCRAEQIPVDANDPVNSAYRYKCVCHSTHFLSKE